MSRIDPTGSWRAAVSGTNRRPLIPGTARLANADPAGTLTNTFPLAGATLTDLPTTGGESAAGQEEPPAAEAPDPARLRLTLSA